MHFHALATADGQKSVSMVFFGVPDVHLRFLLGS